MADMGFDITLEGLCGYISQHGDDRQHGLVECAVKAYRRQLENWWRDTILIKYNTAKDDHGKRQCLVAYLLNPALGGFPAEAPSDLPGQKADDDDEPPAKVRRAHEAGRAGVDLASPTAARAAPM